MTVATQKLTFIGQVYQTLASKTDLIVIQLYSSFVVLILLTEVVTPVTAGHVSSVLEENSLPLATCMEITTSILYRLIYEYNTILLTIHRYSHPLAS